MQIKCKFKNDFIAEEVLEDLGFELEEKQDNKHRNVYYEGKHVGTLFSSSTFTFFDYALAGSRKYRGNAAAIREELEKYRTTE